jgi:hypothetical protein
MRTSISDFIEDVKDISEKMKSGRFIDANEDLDDLLYRLEWKQMRLKKYAKGQSTFPSEDYDWYIKTDLSKYAGEWIAIVNQRVAAHSTGISDVVAKTKNLKKRPLFAFVYGKDVIL